MLVICENSWFLLFKQYICDSWIKTQTGVEEKTLANVSLSINSVCVCVCVCLDTCSTFHPSGLESFPVYP